METYRTAPLRWAVVAEVKQFRLPVRELERVEIIHSAQSPFNSPKWPVKKPDSSWRKAVGDRELNKVVSTSPSSTLL